MIDPDVGQRLHVSRGVPCCLCNSPRVHQKLRVRRSSVRLPCCEYRWMRRRNRQQRFCFLHRIRRRQHRRHRRIQRTRIGS